MSVTPSASLQIVAPLSGILVPLGNVPDPVFAQKMVGDGVSIDPTSSDLLAPVSGTITQVHASKHALTITSTQGLEILIHIGLETVNLKGQGFDCKVTQGQTVKAGDLLIRFDPILVGRKANSLLTQIVVANMEKVASLSAAGGTVRAGQDVILSPVLAHPASVNAAAAVRPAGQGSTVLSAPIAVPQHAGLHARPAALLTQAAKKFASDVRLLHGAAEVNARSVVAILGLGIKHGDTVRFKATGSDASEAVETLSALLSAGRDEPSEGVSEHGQAAVRATAAHAKEFAGVPASPGSAVGRVWQYRPSVVDVPEYGLGAVRERSLLESALRSARAQIEDLVKGQAAGPKAQILSAHLEILEDPDLEAEALEEIQGGRSAGFSWRAAYMDCAAGLESMAGQRFKERAGDIRDVGQRVLLILAGSQKGPLDAPAGCVLIAEDFSPSDAAQLDPSKILGLCSTTGGATSHVAILARSLGIPAICAMDRAILELPDRALVSLNGAKGLLRLDPGADEVEAIASERARKDSRRGADLAAAKLSARTKDGALIEVAANITSAAQAKEAVAAGADGVGLLRTEFLFDGRASAPSEAEQAEQYKAMAEALGPKRKLVIRTLDAGGDKPLSYLPLPKEDNPFLGIRGIRASLEHPELLRTQLRAILGAAPLGDIHVMFPMVATLEELVAAKRILAEESRAKGVTVKVGVMVEVPSAALCADSLAEAADFFSIGSNDLTQYCLAMDRGHPKLASQADALHPSVLKLIGLTADAAHRHGRWVGICGGIASDVLAVPVLIGLGVDELSVSIPAIGGIKARVGQLEKGACQALAKELITLGSAADVRARLEGAF